MYRMEGVEGLYKKFGVLADAKDKAGEVLIFLCYYFFNNPSEFIGLLITPFSIYITPFLFPETVSIMF